MYSTNIYLSPISCIYIVLARCKSLQKQINVLKECWEKIFVRLVSVFLLSAGSIYEPTSYVCNSVNSKMLLSRDYYAFGFSHTDVNQTFLLMTSYLEQFFKVLYVFLVLLFVTYWLVVIHGQLQDSIVQFIHDLKLNCNSLCSTP